MVKRTFTLLFLLLGSLEAKEAKKRAKVGLDEVLVYGVIGGSCLLGGLKLLNRTRNGANQKKQTQKRKARKLAPPNNKRRNSVDHENSGSINTGMYINSLGVQVPVGTTFGARPPADIGLSESDDDDDSYGTGDNTIELVNSFSNLSDQLSKPFELELQTSNDITEIPPIDQEEVDALEKRINKLNERVEALSPQALNKGGGDEDEEASPTGSVVIHDGVEEKQGEVTQTTPPPNVPPVIGSGDEKEDSQSDTASVTSSSDAQGSLGGSAPIKIIQSYSGVASLNPNSPEAKAATEKFYGKKNNRLKVVGGRPGKSKKTKKNKPKKYDKR